jgi:hypothetical protein
MFSSSYPQPAEQHSQTTHRPRSGIYLKEIGLDKVRKGKELGSTNKYINDHPRCRSYDK